MKKKILWGSFVHKFRPVLFDEFFCSSFSLTTHIFFSMIYGYSNTYIMRIIKLFCHVKFLCKAIKYKNDNVNINETRLVCVYFIGGGFNNCNIPSDKFLYKCLHSSYQLTWSWIEQYERKKEMVVSFFLKSNKRGFLRGHYNWKSFLLLAKLLKISRREEEERPSNNIM